MIRCLIPIVLMTGLSGKQAIAARSAVTTLGLQCEYLHEPLGLDTLQPRLSWRMATSDAKRFDLRQTAYEIKVASSLKVLAGNKADLWNSGTVGTSRSTLVQYTGKPLHSEEECWWKVRVRDDKGTFTAWSKPARWTMGILHPSEWKAQWICAPPVTTRSSDPRPDPWLRKQFTLAWTPKRAVIHVAAIGYYELYVNGKKVGDEVLEGAVSDYTKRARYRTYEIGKYLTKGKNVIGLWLGTGWSIYPTYKTKDRPVGPLVIAQGTIQSAKGRTMAVATDGSWGYRESPNRLLGRFGNGSFGGESFDATKDDPAWCTTADSAPWESAMVLPLKRILSAEVLEPNRIEHVFHPIALSPQSVGAFRVDMGRNFAGWVEVPVEAAPGTHVRFQFSERINETMTYGLQSEYIVGPSGKGVWRNRFNYMSGRMMTVTGLDHIPWMSAINCEQLRSDYQRAGGFSSSDPLLNQVYNTTIWTFENLSLGGYVVDCPQRERRGYGGDAHATTQTALDNFNMGAFYTKWSQDWRDVQSPDGDLPYTAPTYSGGGGVPWQGFCVHLPWKVYLQYGDTRILRDNFPTMRRWLAFMQTHVSDGLLQRWGGQWDFLGDWVWPYDPRSDIPNGDLPETLFFNNCYYAYALETTAKIARILGDSQAAAEYGDEAFRLTKAIHVRWYRPATHDYPNGKQNCLALALIANVPPPSERPKVWKRLEDEILVHRQGHIDAGITGGALLTRLLIDSGRADLMYAMATKDDYPSWGYFLEGGQTTFPETWEDAHPSSGYLFKNGETTMLVTKENEKSLLHSSYLFVGAWFIEGLAGIQPGPDGGYQNFVLEPYFGTAPQLKHVTAHYDSPFGRIACGWTKTGNTVKLHVGVPPNTQARLVYPISLKLIQSKSGNQWIGGAAGDPNSLRLEPGSYDFEFVYAKPKK
jgi:alpha-L-rhamnosidase